jgi:SAM-dependent methyltransferase
VRSAVSSTVKQVSRLFATRLPGLRSLVNDRDRLNVDHQIVMAQRDALGRTAHELLVLRNEPRAYLASRFLQGSGLEIGALHRPVPPPVDVLVRYVDRMPASELRTHYPEWDEDDIPEPDVIDDGELLINIADSSVDFIIANHFLEHCEDPIGTLLVHLQRLRPNGHLFYAIPDKRHTFDAPRNATTLEHLIQDHCDGGKQSRREHFVDYARHVHLANHIEEHATTLETTNYSIHFHVWTSSEFLELLLYIQRMYEPNLEVVALQQFEDEFIIVAKKNVEHAVVVLTPVATIA